MAKRKLSRDQRRKQKKDKRQRQFGGFGRKQPKNTDGMSSTFMEFIEPYMPMVNNQDAMEKLLMVAIEAWNSGLLPTEQQDARIQVMTQSIPLDIRDDFEAMLRQLVERKNTQFAEYTDELLDYELAKMRDGYRVSVTSAVIGDGDVTD